ncbi:hypothetical protein PV325_013081, partial [Microctonus aethiopoides]
MSVRFMGHSYEDECDRCRCEPNGSMKKQYNELIKNLEDDFKSCLKLNNTTKSIIYANKRRRIGAKNLQLLNKILKKCKTRSDEVQVLTYISQLQSLIVKFCCGFNQLTLELINAWQHFPSQYTVHYFWGEFWSASPIVLVTIAVQ